MPRSSSRGRSSPSPSRNATTATRPMPAQQAPLQQPQTQQKSGGMLSGIGSTIVQGMAFGAGSEVAHQAVRSLMGGSSHSQPQQQPQQQAPQQQQNPCQTEMYNFSNCLSNNDNLQYCQNFSDMLKTCKQNNNLLWMIWTPNKNLFIYQENSINKRSYLSNLRVVLYRFEFFNYAQALLYCTFHPVLKLNRFSHHLTAQVVL